MHITSHLDVDLVAIESDDTVTVMLELQAPEAPESEGPRAEHTAVVVLDRSGSMGGQRLEHAKRALLTLVDRLDDRDRFGLVVFDHEASVAVPAGRVGETGRTAIRAAIAAVTVRGSTDLSSGYLRGLQEAKRVASPTGATIVLVSDGHANAGIVDPARLEGVAAKHSRDAISTSTIGIGIGYDDRILAALAGGGSGNHHFAMEADQAGAVLAGEIEGLLAKTVQAASLHIRPTDDVAGGKLLNDGLPVQQVEDGVLAELGDMYAGEMRKVLLTIDVPAMARLGLATIATLTLTYVELPSLEEHTVTLPISVNVVPADIAEGRTAKPEVSAEKLFLDTQRRKRAVEDALAPATSPPPGR